MENTYKDYWAYKQIKEAGWPIKVRKESVTIYFDKLGGDVYAHFTIKHVVDKELGLDEYAVKLDNDWLDGEFDYLSDTWDQAVKNACYYFITRF